MWYEVWRYPCAKEEFRWLIELENIFVRELHTYVEGFDILGWWKINANKYLVL